MKKNVEKIIIYGLVLVAYLVLIYEYFSKEVIDNSTLFLGIIVILLVLMIILVEINDPYSKAKK